ncbi:hypothetical protein EJ07DRAFT_157051 [Lizonia empirigonia]|nr:hypothetical protein EJ07DRAFT_157051 [Lizonia empirigonia]
MDVRRRAERGRQMEYGWAAVAAGGAPGAGCWTRAGSRWVGREERAVAVVRLRAERTRSGAGGTRRGGLRRAVLAAAGRGGRRGKRQTADSDAQRPGTRARCSVAGAAQRRAAPRLVGSDDLWLNLGQVRCAHGPRGAEGTKYGSCSLPGLFRIQKSAPGRSLGWTMGANGSTTRQTRRQKPVAEIESAGWVGNLSSAARELKAQPLRTPHRAPAASQSPPRTPLEPDKPQPRATLQTPQRRAAALSSPAKSTIAQYSLIVQFHSERHCRAFCDETAMPHPAASPA